MGIEIEEMQDPPLTPLGLQQAHETGIYLKTFLESNGYTKIIIQSSPYLRCLQTAKESAKILGIPTIEVNYMLSEWMKSTFFESNPIETLLIRNRDKKYIIEKYLDGI